MPGFFVLHECICDLNILLIASCTAVAFPISCQYQRLWFWWNSTYKFLTGEIRILKAKLWYYVVILPCCEGCTSASYVVEEYGECSPGMKPLILFNFTSVFPQHLQRSQCFQTWQLFDSWKISIKASKKINKSLPGAELAAAIDYSFHCIALPGRKTILSDLMLNANWPGRWKFRNKHCPRRWKTSAHNG